MLGVEVEGYDDAAAAARWQWLPYLDIVPNPKLSKRRNRPRILSVQFACFRLSPARGRELYGGDSYLFAYLEIR